MYTFKELPDMHDPDVRDRILHRIRSGKLQYVCDFAVDTLGQDNRGLRL